MYAEQNKLIFTEHTCAYLQEFIMVRAGLLSEDLRDLLTGFRS